MFIDVKDLHGLRIYRDVYGNDEPYRIAVDTCSGYNLVRRDRLPSDWERHIVPDAPLPRLAGATSNPLRLTAVVRLCVRLGNIVYRLPFVVAESLAVGVILGTAFIDRHIRNIAIDKQRIDFRRGGGIAIVDAKGGGTDAPEYGTDKRKRSRKNRLDNGPYETDAQPIRLARWVPVPAMSQLSVRVTTPGTGLVFLEPKPSLQHRHGVRLTKGIAEVLPNRTFDVLVANFSKKPRRLPKNTIIGYAKRNPIAIVTPDRNVAEEFGKVLKVTTLPNDEPGTENTNYDTESRDGRKRD